MQLEATSGLVDLDPEFGAAPFASGRPICGGTFMAVEEDGEYRPRTIDAAESDIVSVRVGGKL
jgi:hypothetical protein